MPSYPPADRSLGLCSFLSGHASRRRSLQPLCRRKDNRYLSSPAGRRLHFCAVDINEAESWILNHQLSQHFLELTRFRSQRLHLDRGRLSGNIARQALLAGFEKNRGPAVTEMLIDPFLAAQLSDAVLTTQASQDDPDFLLRRILSTRSTANVPGVLPRFPGTVLTTLFLSYRFPSRVYDRPKIFSCSIRLLRPTCADAEQ